MNLRNIKTLSLEQKAQQAEAINLLKLMIKTESLRKNLETKRAIFKQALTILDNMVEGGFGQALNNALTIEVMNSAADGLFSPEIGELVRHYISVCDGYSNVMHELNPTSIEPLELIWLKLAAKNGTPAARFDYASYLWYQKDSFSDALYCFSTIADWHHERDPSECARFGLTAQENAEYALRAAYFVSSHYLESRDFENARIWLNKAIEIEAFLDIPPPKRIAAQNLAALGIHTNAGGFFDISSPKRVFSFYPEELTNENIELFKAGALNGKNGEPDKYKCRLVLDYYLSKGKTEEYVFFGRKCGPIVASPEEKSAWGLLKIALPTSAVASPAVPGNISPRLRLLAPPSAAASISPPAPNELKSESKRLGKTS